MPGSEARAFISATPVNHNDPLRSARLSSASPLQSSRRQPRQKLRRGHPEPRMPPLRRDLMERYQHEAPLLEPRMRQHEIGHRALDAVIIEQVEIERTSGGAHTALAPEAGFERKQPRKQLGRGPLSPDLD